MPRFMPRDFGTCTYFAGTGMQITVSDIGTVLNLKSATPPSFTIAAWFNPLQVQNDLSGIGLMNSSCRLALRNTRIPFFQIKAGSSLCTGTFPLVPNRWHRLVGTYNNTTQRMSLYVNGVLNATNISADVDLSALTRNFIMSGAGGNYGGFLDDVQVSSYLALPIDIQADYFAGLPFPNLVTWHKMDEGTGTTTADSSGNGFNGTFVGTVTWSTNVVMKTRTRVTTPDRSLSSTARTPISIARSLTP